MVCGKASAFRSECHSSSLEKLGIGAPPAVNILVQVGLSHISISISYWQRRQVQDVLNKDWVESSLPSGKAPGLEKHLNVFPFTIHL